MAGVILVFAAIIHIGVVVIVLEDFLSDRHQPIIMISAEEGSRWMSVFQR